MLTAWLVGGGWGGRAPVGKAYYSYFDYRRSRARAWAFGLESAPSPRTHICVGLERKRPRGWRGCFTHIWLVKSIWCAEETQRRCPFSRPIVSSPKPYTHSPYTQTTLALLLQATAIVRMQKHAIHDNIVYIYIWLRDSITFVCVFWNNIW